MKRERDIQSNKQFILNALQNSISQISLELITENHFSYLSTESKIKYLTKFIIAIESIFTTLKMYSNNNFGSITEFIGLIIQNQSEFQLFKTKFLSEQNADNKFLIEIFKELTSSKWFNIIYRHYQKIQLNLNSLCEPSFDQENSKKQKTETNTNAYQTEVYKILINNHLNDEKTNFSLKIACNALPQEKTLQETFENHYETEGNYSSHFQTLFSFVRDFKNHSLEQNLNDDDFVSFFDKKNIYDLDLIQYARAKNNLKAIEIIFNKAKAYCKDNELAYLDFAIACYEFSTEEEIKTEIDNCIKTDPENIYKFIIDQKHDCFNELIETLIHQGKREILDYLVKVKDDFANLIFIEMHGYKDRNALDLAFIHKQQTLISFFLTNGAIPYTDTDACWSNAIAYCAIDKNIDAFTSILNALAIENALHKKLLYLIFTKDLQQVKSLLENNTINLYDVEKSAFSFVMPLALAAACGDENIFELLLEQPVPSNDKVPYVFTLKLALSYAIFCKQNIIAKKLLEFSDIIFPRETINDPIFLPVLPSEAAAISNNAEIFSLLPLDALNIPRVFELAYIHKNLDLIIWINTRFKDIPDNLVKKFYSVIDGYSSEIVTDLIKSAILKKHYAALTILLDLLQKLQSSLQNNDEPRASSLLRIVNEHLDLAVIFSAIFANNKTLSLIQQIIQPDIFIAKFTLKHLKKITNKDISDFEKILGPKISSNEKISLFEILYARNHFEFLLKNIKSLTFTDDNFSRDVVTLLITLALFREKLSANQMQFFTDCFVYLCQFENTKKCFLGIGEKNYQSLFILFIEANLMRLFFLNMPSSLQVELLKFISSKQLLSSLLCDVIQHKKDDPNLLIDVCLLLQHGADHISAYSLAIKLEIKPILDLFNLYDTLNTAGDNINALKMKIRIILQPIINKTILNNSLNHEEHKQRIYDFFANLALANSFDALKQTIRKFGQTYQTNQPLKFTLDGCSSFIEKCLKENPVVINYQALEF